MSFVHLNTHSHYSLLDALGTPKDLVKKAKEYGCAAIGLTDNAYLYGAVEFYKAAKDAGVKAIIGCEFYITPDSHFDKSPESAKNTYRLTVLAKNDQGYQNLLILSTAASMEGFNTYPRIDHGLLKKYSDGLIVLSGNKDSELSQALLTDDLEKVEKISEFYQDLFGEDYYLEIQRHPEISEYQQLESKLLELAEKKNIEIVATQSSHYLYSSDADTHDILLCIGRQTNINDPNRYRYPGDFSMKSPEAMLELFADLPRACENTVKIAEKCNISIKFGQYLIPKYKTPNSETSKEYLRFLCERGLKELYLETMHAKAQKQLDYELEVVDKMGFNDYFLIVWDFIDYAKRSGIMVGPGRGSAAGAIIAYTLKITELDPLEHGLIFERFLNPDRISMPDIDIDFADHRRHEVLEYTIDKYGKDCVSQVITYGTMSAKAAVRDVGRGMGYQYSEVDQIAKVVPPPVLGKHTPLKISTEKDPQLSEVYKNNPRAKALLDNAIKLEGTVRHAGTHACAVIIADRPLVNFSPLQKATDGSEGIVTQYSMKYLEDIGLLKMDFLGLKNLTIIENALNLIQKTTGEKIDITKIPLTDKKTFELLQRGDTTGVFQLESSGMRRYIKELKPTYFEDIVAMISLYRPGPMEWIPQYIEGKHHPETIKYLDPSFDKILKETNGVAIYQEQILLIARQYAGFSLGEADILRRAVGKKDPKALAEQKDKFIQGAINCGHTQKHGQEIFEKVIEPFAGYGFNKSHAACYAMISYRTSYLKARYPTELMTALMTSDSDNTEKISLEMQDCDGLGIEVLPPSINHSELEFSVVKNGQIRFGLGAIKGLGEGAIQHIMSSRREQGEFKSIEDLAARLPSKLLNKKTIECLAYSGALDQFGERRQIAENYESISEYAKNLEKAANKVEGQTDLFGSFEDGAAPVERIKLRPVEPTSVMEKLKKEKQYLGLYVSSTPLKGLSQYLKKKAKFIGDFTNKDLDKNQKIAGILTNLRTIITKSGKAMAYAELEDSTAKINLVIFPNTYEQFKFKIKEDQLLIIDGKLENKRGLQFTVMDIKSASLETMIKNATEAGIYDPNEKIIKRQPQVDAYKSEQNIESKNAQSNNKKADHLENNSLPSNQTASYKTSAHLVLSQDTILIKVPKAFPATKLPELKLLLSKYPGNLIVELEIFHQEKLQKIKTDIKVDYSHGLSEGLESLLNKTS